MGVIGQGQPPPVAVEVRRGGVPESAHRAHIAVVGAHGRVTAAAGDPEAIVFPRSTLKPLLTATLIALGWAPDDGARIAVASSSHSGEPAHLAKVREILATADLDEDLLGNTPDWPFDEQVRTAVIAGGGEKSSLYANCSGKHAAMLATCVANGWPLADYTSPTHPLQRALAEGLAAQTGTELLGPSVDGCGAPVWAMPLSGLARGFSGLVQAAPGSPGAAVAEAMRTFPEYVGGEHRDVTELMRAVPGLVAKDGADAVYAAALPDGRGVAVKVEDGGARARPAVIAGTLAELGIPAATLAPILAWEQVRGGGEVVGELRSVVELQPR